MELLRPVHKLPRGLSGVPYGELVYFDQSLVVATADLSLIHHKQTRALLVQDIGCSIKGYGPQVDICRCILRILQRKLKKTHIALGEMESLATDVKGYLHRNLVQDNLEFGTLRLPILKP